MILQSLANLAHREGLTESPDYEPKEIHWLIRLRPDGLFLALESLLQQPDTGKKKARSKPRGMSSLAPRAFPGAAGSGIAMDAPFLVGNASFVCGLDVTKEQKHAARAGELERRIAAFRALVAAGRAETTDAGLAAVEAFLRSAAHLEKARAVVGKRAKDGELESNHLIAFVLEADDSPVHLRPAVQRYWSRYRSELTAGERRAQCLVTGLVGPTADKHPLIKPVPGGTPSGVAIVSFNASAFESYGFSRNENAPVSRAAAEAYTTALNRLLKPGWPDPRKPNETLPEQRVRLSSDTIAVFWTDVASRVPAAIGPAVDGGDAAAAEALGIVLAPDPSYEHLDANLWTQASTEPLRAAHEAAWKGISPAELEDPSAFRLLILSGGQGRATIRAFHSSTVQDVVLAVRQWFEDIALSTSRGRPALRWLLSTLAVRGDKDRIPPNLAAEVFLAILANDPLPVTVLETVRPTVPQ